VTVLGEEVANFGGGAYGATRNLPQQYPTRVLNMPISEGGFVGLGLGMAMLGMPTVVEIMFPDFSFVAADQLFNQVAKARHMYGGTTDLPLVVRTRIATGCGYGGQHSMNPAGLYALFSGWRIVAPSDAFDYVGLFNAAMISRDPVLVLEHHALYGQATPLPVDDLDYVIRLGRARRLAAGGDVTLLTYGVLVPRCQALLERWTAAGIGVDLIDLRTLDYPSVDYALIGESVARTGALVIAEEACRSQALGHVIGREVTERWFDELDGPVCCLTSQDVPPSVSRWLEAAVMLQDEEIFTTTLAVAQRRWR
jgi:2-oxoisovalerate dehydrogenase E1 component